MLKVPEIINVPKKMLPILKEFNDYRFFLASGGRGSGKTQTFGRVILYITSTKKVRVVCGRETQATIGESVYTLLTDLIKEYNLDYTVTQAKITHNKTGSEIVFKGFREQGAVNIKGLEGADIIWVDEAEAITKQTLDILVPTIRKPNSKIFFSMNRKHRNDPVYEFCANRSNAKIIHINYYDNPYCPQELLDEASECKRLNESDYNHIWLGMPLDLSDDCLFSTKKLDEAKEVRPSDDGHLEQRVIAIDFAAMGGDLCVASIVKRISNTDWALEEQIAWNYTDPMESIGRIVGILGQYHYDAAVLDVGGMGTVVFSRLKELGIDINKFDGASTQGIPQEYHNARAYGYFSLRNMIDNNQMRCTNLDTIRELEGIRYKYASSGKRLIISKEEMRKNKLKSPDRADSLMMAVYAIRQLLGRVKASQEIKIKTTKRWK